LSPSSVSSRNRAIGGKRDGHNGRAVVIKLLNDRRSGVFRKLRPRRVDAIANVLRRRFEIAIEFEGGDDDRSSLTGDERSSSDAVDGVNYFFDLLRDERLDFFRRSAGKTGAHETVGRSTEGKRSTPSRKKPAVPDHDQRQHDHRREDRTANTDFG
jgi:hypothetical protein